MAAHGDAEESQPDWMGKLDWLGVQYYFRAGVTAELDLNAMASMPL